MNEFTHKGRHDTELSYINKEQLRDDIYDTTLISQSTECLCLSDEKKYLGETPVQLLKFNTQNERKGVALDEISDFETNERNNDLHDNINTQEGASDQTIFFECGNEKDNSVKQHAGEQIGDSTEKQSLDHLASKLAEIELGVKNEMISNGTFKQSSKTRNEDFDLTEIMNTLTKIQINAQDCFNFSQEPLLIKENK